MYSIKRHLLNEMALISQGEFITRIIDVIKEKPVCAGVFGASSYQDIHNLMKLNTQSNRLTSERPDMNSTYNRIRSWYW